MVELAKLADIQRIVYPQGGHPSTARHDAGQGEFANDQRSNHCAMPPRGNMCKAS